MRDGSLRGANLRGANWFDGCFQIPFFTSADLRGADLTGANLSGANLAGANLTEAILTRANLSQVDLADADLIAADLREAILRDVRLDRAKLTDVTCGSTIFADLDLSHIGGLESIRHVGPSTVGIDTLYKSRGQIPEVFLRGCGVPEHLVTHCRTLVEQAVYFFPAFISYSRKDTHFARRLHDILQSRGVRCWLETEHITPAHHFWYESEGGNRLWDKVILCCSKHSLTGDWLDRELESLFTKEQEIEEDLGWEPDPDPSLARLLIPLDLDGHLVSDAYRGSMKQKIINRRVVGFNNWEDNPDKLDKGIAEVIAALSLGEGREPPRNYW
jgi:hypothetical protein